MKKSKLLFFKKLASQSMLNGTLMKDNSKASNALIRKKEIWALKNTFY